MNDQIWFIYLTDHHEGPFTPTEVAGKVAAGAVTAQSLGWKDGMAEWVPIESIPELAAALGGAPAAPPAAAAPAAAGPAPEGEEGFSLAQLLAQQQGGGGVPSAAPVTEDPSLATGFTGAASVLSSLAGSVQAAHPMNTGSVTIDAGGLTGGVSASVGGEVGPDEEVWTLRIGNQVSGLHSLNRLKSLAGEGEIPPDAFLWHPGWPDFQPIATVPEVSSARRQRKMTSNQSGANSQASLKQGAGKTGGMNRPAFAPITSGANVGDDDPTDPSIKFNDSPTGFKGLLARVKNLMKRKENAKQAKAAPVKVTAKKSGGGASDKIKRVGIILGSVAVIAGAGAAYFILFSSPIPSDLDVIADDLEAMRATLAAPEGSAKMHLALARGTEDNPADDTAPKFYVATGLAEGTGITLTVTGQPGTLVNRLSFEKSFNASVNKDHLAVFESVQDGGKPLPMGEYTIKVAAEGAEPLTLTRFLGGKKGAIYSDRLKKYKDKLQGDYDKEMQELKEYVDTLKSVQTDISKRTGEYKTGWATAANRPRILADWKSFSLGAQGMASQVDTKLKARVAAATQTFHPRAFEDVSTTLGQIQQLLQMHGQRLEGATPSGNPDELEGLAQAGVVSLEQFLAQALVKSPFDVMSIDNVPGGAAAPAPGAVPAAKP